MKDHFLGINAGLEQNRQLASRREIKAQTLSLDQRTKARQRKALVA